MSEATKPVPPMRVASRVEGPFINAYIAEPHTMDGAILIGSIAVKMCSDDRELYERWISLMKEAVAAQIERVTKLKPEFDEPVKAPEHERSGHG